MSRRAHFGSARTCCHAALAADAPRGTSPTPQPDSLVATACTPASSSKSTRCDCSPGRVRTRRRRLSVPLRPSNTNGVGGRGCATKRVGAPPVALHDGTASVSLSVEAVESVAVPWRLRGASTCALAGGLPRTTRRCSAGGVAAPNGRAPPRRPAWLRATAAVPIMASALGGFATQLR